MVAPILSRLLKQTIVYEKAIQDEYVVSFEAPVEIDRVCVQIAKTHRKNNDYKEFSGYNALIFYDVVKSTPSNIEFEVDSRITYKNRQYIIKNVIEETIGNKLHHIEIEVV